MDWILAACGTPNDDLPPWLERHRNGEPGRWWPPPAWPPRSADDVHTAEAARMLPLACT